MSTSRCGNICIMQPKCSRKERRRVFSNRSSDDAAVSGRRCVFLGKSKSILFGLQKVDAFRNHWLRFVYNTTAQAKCSNWCNAFYGQQFSEPRRVQGWLCTKAISKKKGPIPTLLWQSGTSESLLKAKASDYGKASYISNVCLWCSANHNALCQLANQSRLCLSEGGTL